MSLDPSDHDRLILLEAHLSQLRHELMAQRVEAKEHRTLIMAQIEANAEAVAALMALASKGKAFLAGVICLGTIAGGAATWLADHLLRILR